MPASTPSRHFMLTAHCSVHSAPLSGSSVTSGLGWLTGTRRSPATLLSFEKQMKPHLNVSGLTAHLLPSSGTVRFWPNSQVPLPSLLNCSIGSPERPVTYVVSTLLSAAVSAVSAVEASALAFGAGATGLLPLSLSPTGLSRSGFGLGLGSLLMVAFL